MTRGEHAFVQFHSRERQYAFALTVGRIPASARRSALAAQRATTSQDDVGYGAMLRLRG